MALIIPTDIPLIALIIYAMANTIVIVLPCLCQNMLFSPLRSSLPFEYSARTRSSRMSSMFQNTNYCMSSKMALQSMQSINNGSVGKNEHLWAICGVSYTHVVSPLGNIYYLQYLRTRTDAWILQDPHLDKSQFKLQINMKLLTMLRWYCRHWL